MFDVSSCEFLQLPYPATIVVSTGVTASRTDSSARPNFTRMRRRHGSAASFWRMAWFRRSDGVLVAIITESAPGLL